MAFRISYTEAEIRNEVIYSAVLFMNGQRVSFFENSIGRDLDKAVKKLIRDWEASNSIFCYTQWDKVEIYSSSRHMLTLTYGQRFETINELF